MSFLKIKQVFLSFVLLSLVNMSFVNADDHEFDPADLNKDGTIDSFEDCVVIKKFPESFCESAIKVRDSLEPGDALHSEEDEEDQFDEIVDENDRMCTEQYQPVCAEIKVQCFAAPCPPIQETFSNKCFAEIDHAHILHQGECENHSDDFNDDENHEFEEDEREGDFDDRSDFRDNMKDRMKDMRERMRGPHDEDHFDRDEHDDFEDDRRDMRRGGEDFENRRGDENFNEHGEFEEDFSMRFNDFDPDLNFDGTVDDFELKISDCLNELGEFRMHFCQKQVKKQLHNEWKTWEPDDFMKGSEEEGFFDDFDPEFFNDFEEEDFNDFNPEFFNGFVDEAPENFRRFNPQMFEFMDPKRMDEFDPRIFEHMKQFGKNINPEIFGNIEDDEFFDEFDPDFFNHVDFDKIPEDIFDKIDVSQFNEIKPELLDKFEQFAPERFNMIPKKVRRAAEIMSDDLSDDLLLEFGFSGEEASRVKNLMKTVNKQKREDVMNILDDIDEDIRRGFMDFESDFEQEVGSFMEYMPHVPKGLQEEFLGHKKGFLEGAKKLKEEFKNVESSLNDEVQGMLNDLSEELASYNFSGKAAEDLQEYIDQFFIDIESLSVTQIETAVEELLHTLNELKGDAREEKFSQGIIPFKDTDDNEWFTSFVNSAADGGVIGGYKDVNGNSLGEFRPANKVTVAEALKMSLANAGLKENSGTPAHSNALDHWVKGWVKTAESKSISLSDSIDFNRGATRGEVVRWIIESFGIAPPNSDVSSFSDVRKNDTNLNYIEYAKTMGLISGDGETGKFRPNDSIIRAEVVKILEKASEVLASK